MQGIGEKLSGPLRLPPTPAVLINPGVWLATKDVFAGWNAAGSAAPLDVEAVMRVMSHADLLQFLAAQPNDLEAAAIALAPPIASVLAGLRAQPGCELARMSGSGATCFGLFASAPAATAAVTEIGDKHPGWWLRACVLG
jgi:4-diphosphocytidyl-2-C-methyl-D-erythritol kinase